MLIENQIENFLILIKLDFIATEGETDNFHRPYKFV